MVNTPEREEIILLHTNDLHFNFNHSEVFEKVVRNFRDTYENVFLIDAGDVFVRLEQYWPEGGLEFYEHRGRYMIEKMNEVGYDVVTLGNNELNYKKTVTRDNLRLARFHLLGANVEVSTDEFDHPEPCAVFETACGHTLAVLGLSLAQKTGYPEGITVRPPDETLEDYLYLREKYDVLVLLNHLGVKRDRELAEKFGRVDAIVGGQSHTLLNPAEIVNGVLVCQAGGHTPKKMNPDATRFLGVIRILLEDGRVSRKSGEVLNIDAGDKTCSGLGNGSSSGI